jgi:hypothetical protein
MKKTGFDAFLKTREEAANAYVRGDGAKLDTIVSHDGTATFHSPRGDTVIGARAVAERYLEDSKAFHSNGTSRLEMIQQGHDGNLGFWVGPDRDSTDWPHTWSGEHARTCDGTLLQTRWRMEIDPSPCGCPAKVRMDEFCFCTGLLWQQFSAPCYSVSRSL